ncbi:MAG: SOS response-associated peptidase [Pseudomonadota bacterium]
MCGRFTLTDPADDIADVLGADIDDGLAEGLPPRWNIAPGQPILIAHKDDKAPLAERRRRLSLMRWGLIPSWAKGDTLTRLAKQPLIHARCETVAEKPSFRAAWRRRRGLVPANAFYEWRRVKSGVQPYRVTPAPHSSAHHFYLAALWETAYDADGGDYDTAALITCAAGPDIADIHHREPVIVPLNAVDAWLSDDETRAADAAPVLHAAPPGFWRAARCSTAVNNAHNEGPALARTLQAFEDATINTDDAAQKSDAVHSSADNSTTTSDKPAPEAQKNDTPIQGNLFTD